MLNSTDCYAILLIIRYGRREKLKSCINFSLLKITVILILIHLQRGIYPLESIILDMQIAQTKGLRFIFSCLFIVQIRIIVMK
jgi:hypothetical protein